MENKLIRSVSVIADEINQIKSQTSGILTAAFTYAKRSCFEIGKRLEEAKAQIPHGEWGAWLDTNFEYSESTAGNLMRIYREFGSEQIDMISGRSPAETFEGLSQSQLIELFALPSGERAQFVDEHREELEDGMSVRDMRELIRAQKETIEKQKKDILDNDESYAELVEKLRDAEREAVAKQSEIDEVKELKRELQIELDLIKEKPIEASVVTEKVYEPSDEQIAEIKAAEEKKYAAKIKKLEGELNKKTAELDKKDSEGEGALKKIEEEYAEKMKALEEEHQKRLKQMATRSDPHSARVGFALEAIGRAIADINAEITAMDKEEAGSGARMRARCESTLLGLINRAGWQI